MNTSITEAVESNHDELLEHLDSEWVQLIKFAKELGLTVEEIRNFLTSR